MKMLWKCLGGLLLMLSLAACQTATELATSDMAAQMAKAQGVPQIGAFLPYEYSVPRTEVSAIDGVWRISTNKKRVRINAGRMYAVDPWVHAFTLKVQPDMVTAKDMYRVGPGLFSSYDLILLGNSTSQILESGVVNVKVASAVGPVEFNLLPLSVDDPEAFTAEMELSGFSPVMLPQTVL